MNHQLDTENEKIATILQSFIAGALFTMLLMGFLNVYGYRQYLKNNPQPEIIQSISDTPITPASKNEIVELELELCKGTSNPAQCFQDYLDGAKK